MLGSRAQQVQIAIVTVDPARDTPSQMHRFLSRLRDPNGSQIVGLTGSAQQIAAVERAYHVWSQRMPQRHGGYEVAHSSIVFIINSRGALAGTRDDDDSQSALLASLEPTLQ
jgi:protein SCO1/2